MTPNYITMFPQREQWCTCIDCLFVDELRERQHYFVIRMDFYIILYAAISSMIHLNGLEWCKIIHLYFLK